MSGYVPCLQPAPVEFEKKCVHYSIIDNVNIICFSATSLAKIHDELHILLSYLPFFPSPKDEPKDEALPKDEAVKLKMSYQYFTD